MTLSRRQWVTRSAVATGMVAFPSLVLPQQKFEVKVANFVGPQHFQSQWLVKWGETLEKKSNGRLSFKHFPGAQMGPTPKHFDFARDGTAEMSFFLHGSTPGRFQLTEIVNMPYLVGSAEIGIKVLNDPELRAKYLDAEHRGTKVLFLFTHQPGSVHTTKKAIRSLDDFKGQRLRFSTPAIREFMATGTYDLRKLNFQPAQTPDGKEWQPAVRHLVTNQVIEFNGDTARVISYWMNYSNAADRRKIEWLSYGSWDDELVKVNGEWLFKRHKIYNENNPNRFTAGQASPLAQ